VRLSVFGTTGQLVTTLASGSVRAGNHTVEWDGLDNVAKPAASGVYLCRLSAGGTALVRRMLLLR
jgi:flagellar hook assembly protein FlgD